jgi:hypothetical protein
MNDLFLLFGVLGMVAIALICFGTYAVYGGFKADLCNAQPGQVFNFEYMQPLNGDSKRVLAKVIEKPYRFSDMELQRMNRVSSYRKHDPEFKRTNHIVTCELHDGEVRQFYCERVKNCRKPLFGGLVA